MNILNDLTVSIFMGTEGSYCYLLQDRNIMLRLHGNCKMFYYYLLKVRHTDKYNGPATSFHICFLFEYILLKALTFVSG